MEKVYEAVSLLPQSWDPGSPALGGSAFPLVHRNHIEKLRGHVRVQTDPSRDPNAETVIDLLGFDDRVLHTLLRPHSGRMHQLRVHLAELGAGILNDRFYPTLLPDGPDDFERPLQLLARELRFTDPLTGAPREFVTKRMLHEAPRP